METIKIKTGEALSVYDELLSFEEKDITLPIQFAWDLEDNIEEFKKVADKFGEHRDKILKAAYEKGTLVEENNSMVAAEGKEAEFSEVIKNINEYLMTDNEIQIKKISADVLPEQISPKDLKALKFMITR